ncbi:MAG: coproporphyrinogen-III oxidase family protein, partial [Chitinivibrionales bacterium]
MIFPDPISVYIHFPFCLSKCFYCDFYSEDRTVKKTDKYLKALSTEIRNWHNRMGMTQPGSIYIGGGSPSLMTETQWEILSMTIKEAFSIRDECEYTIECNPETYSLKKAVCWRDTGVNRLSLGIQSLNPDLLKRIGRPHTEKESLDILENLKENPLFTNVSVDLMYGLPGQTTTDINRDTSALIHNYPFIKHFSVYELEMKDNTKIMRYLNSHLMPDEEDLIEMNRAVSESLR